VAEAFQVQEISDGLEQDTAGGRGPTLPSPLFA
jgi:hypothetical protein